ncbi:hypothetical protein HPP92_027974 [Vanilla planifolia]|uniref:Uncharacterized protein n=1 Tax=Vanilla planifolia TaxID=51239 RepID=A0A835P797_VANPL|nr:hypothetical protein HPP92_027974 [Vanilla planifolia]
MAFSRRETEAGRRRRVQGRYQGRRPRGRQSGGRRRTWGDAVDDVSGLVSSSSQSQNATRRRERMGRVRGRRRDEERDGVRRRGRSGWRGWKEDMGWVGDGACVCCGIDCGFLCIEVSIILRYGEPPRSKLVPSVLFSVPYRLRGSSTDLFSDF